MEKSALHTAFAPCAPRPDTPKSHNTMETDLTAPYFCVYLLPAQAGLSTHPAALQAMDADQLTALKRVYEVLNIVSIVALVPALVFQLASKRRRTFPARLLTYVRASRCPRCFPRRRPTPTPLQHPCAVPGFHYQLLCAVAAMGRRC